MIQMTPEEVKSCGYDPTKWHGLIDSWRLHSAPSHGAFLTWHIRPDCPRNHDFAAERWQQNGGSKELRVIDLTSGRCVGARLMPDFTYLPQFLGSRAYDVWED